MRIQDHDNVIAQCKEELTNAYLELDRTIKEFVATAKTYSASWIERYVASFFRRSEQAEHFDKDQVASLKADLKIFIGQNIPDLVDESILQDKHWNHRTTSPHAESSNRRFGVTQWSGMRLPSSYTKALQEAVSPLGKVLVKYGLIDRTAPPGNWKFPADDNPIYTGMLDFEPGEMERMAPLVEIVRKYTDQCTSYIKIVEKLNKAERAKREAEAQNLWDSV